MKKVLVMLLLFVATTPVPGQDKPKNLDWLIKHPVITSLAELQNKQRARYQLPALKLSPDLCLIAQKHAVWMAETGAFQHGWHGHAEIIHWGVVSADDCVNGWIWSPAHHGIMLSGYTEIGCGYFVTQWGTRWVTIFR